MSVSVSVRVSDKKGESKMNRIESVEELDVYKRAHQVTLHTVTVR